MHKKTCNFILMLVSTLTLIVFAQFATQRVTADAVVTPVAGTSYTWSVNSANGDVYWYNNTWSFEGLKNLKTNGSIAFNLTKQATDDNTYSPFTNPVWYGNFSIYHPVEAMQSLNWSKIDCSTTEIGMNLALSALSWCGGLIAPTDWAVNHNIILAQPADNVSYQQLQGLAFIHYEYSGQVTDLMYDMPTGVLIFAKTSMFGYWLEIQLDGYDPSPSIPGPESVLILLITTLMVATIITRMNKNGKQL